MGRKVVPLPLQQLRGDPRNKGRGALGAELDEAVRPAVEIPDKPQHLGREAADEWDRICPHLEQLGLVSQIDRAALAAYCTAWGEYVWAENRIAALNAAAATLTWADLIAGRKPDNTGDRGRIWDTPSGYKQISVPMQIRNRALETMAKYLAEFGMSPASRGRVRASDPQLALPGMQTPQEGGWGDFATTPPAAASST